MGIVKLEVYLIVWSLYDNLICIGIRGIHVGSHSQRKTSLQKNIIKLNLKYYLNFELNFNFILVNLSLLIKTPSNMFNNIYEIK